MKRYIRVPACTGTRHSVPSDPLSRLRERARMRARWSQAIATTAALLSFAGCGGGSSTAPADAMPIASPSDSTGGYMLATVTPTTGTAHVTLYDSTGQHELATFTADAPGTALSFWWTSAPGQTTRVAVRDDSGACTCQLTSNYVPVADTHEPNDAMEAATPMLADGTQMSAFLFAGQHDGTNDPVDYDDFYRFTAQPGALSIHLDGVPADLAARVFLLRADGSEVARVSNGMRGAALALDPPALTDAADLTVRISLWDETPPASGAGTDLPASFTQPYRLTVSQSQP